jgi:DNA-binding transcriptional regulator YdaS (Cro superfamily)
VKLGALWRNLGNSAVYYPKLTRVTGGVTASVLFCQLFHWQSQLSNPNQWVRTTSDDIEKETGLSRTEQELARSELVKRALLKERVVRGQSDTIEFWPDIDVLEQRLNQGWEVNSNNSSGSENDKNNLQASNCSKSSFKNNLHNSSSPTIKEPLIEAVTPVVGEPPNTTNSERTYFPINSSQIPTSIEVPENTSPPNRIVKTDKFFPARRQPIAVKVTPNYQFSGPWESQEQFEEFQRVLLDYFKNQGVERPDGWMFRIVDGMTKGLVSPFWDEFVAGIPLGESQKVKRDWEIEPGVPYPAFEEERIQYYLHKGEPVEVAVARARSDLRHPVLGKDLWEGFLRKCDRIADEAIKAKQLGVSTPYLPPSFTNKPQVTTERVIEKLSIAQGAVPSAIEGRLPLKSSSSDSPTYQSLEPHKIEDENSQSECHTPALSALQEAFKTPMGRTLVKKQIAEHPEWGYGIVDGQVVDLFPF